MPLLRNLLVLVFFGLGLSPLFVQAQNDAAEAKPDTVYLTPGQQLVSSIQQVDDLHQTYHATQDTSQMVAAEKVCSNILSLLDQHHYGLFQAGDPNFSPAIIHQAYERVFLTELSLGLPPEISKNLLFSYPVFESAKQARWQRELANWPVAAVKGLSPELLEEEQAIIKKLQGLESLVYNKQPDSTNLGDRWATYQQQKDAAMPELEAVLERIKTEAPEWYALRWDMNLSSPEQANTDFGDLEPDTYFLEYFFGDSIVAIKGSMGGEGRVLSIPVSDTLLTQLERYRQATTDLNFRLGNPQLAFDQFVSASQYLYQRLVQSPMAGLTADLGKPQRIVVIPDGPLANLSFAALLTDNANLETRDYRKLNYLVRMAPIAYAPSKKQYYASQKLTASGPYEQNYAGFAPNYGATPENSGNGLVYHKQEILDAVQSFFGNGYIGPKATESSFRASAVETDVVHVGATIQGNSGAETAIYFGDISDSLQDGTLYAHELLAMELPTGMAVLGGSGLANNNRHGWNALINGFQFAGTPSLLVNLWNIDHPSTSLVIERYYDGIAEGNDKDKALQQAQLGFLDAADPNMAHPVHWSGLTQTGNLSPLEIQRGPEGDVWQVALLMLGIILFILGGYKLGKLF